MMISSWTNEEIEAIMVQLNNQNLPFNKYEFSLLGEGMRLLGSGAFANVYEALDKGKHVKEAAIKVIGFGNRHVDSESFRSAVEAQKDLGYSVDSVVKIYDSIELRVWIKGNHDVEKVEKVELHEQAKPEGDFLHLQFILMEKVKPVLTSKRFAYKLYPANLQEYAENEIIELAYDIGIAIDRAHKKRIIHRDIKLENVFYDDKQQCYKLGDFGIARTTDDGMASTVAFTKGYGAPEVVGTLDDKYDCTADIYSYGMMLYVLLNELRFPESNDYHPTVFQYIQGYVPPEPVNGSDGLVNVVIKMVNFNPDDRYQSMEEVINKLDELRFGHRIKYQREHKSAALVLGMEFAFMGAVAWKMSFMPELQLVFNSLEYIFCVLCIIQTLLCFLNRKNSIVNIAIFGVGLFLMISSGVTWWKLLLLPVLMACRSLSGIIGGGALAANATYLIMNKYNYSVTEFSEYRWIAVLLLSLSFYLLLLNLLLGERNEKMIKTYFVKNLFWIAVIMTYVLFMVTPLCIKMSQTMSFNSYDILFGSKVTQWIMSWNPYMVGVVGCVFWLVWVIRERFLVVVENMKLRVWHK